MALRTFRNAPSSIGAVAIALGGALVGCGDPDLFKPSAVDVGDIRGVIDGSVTYVGPAPCTENGKILGAAVLLAFEDGALPPPEGLGTSAASLDVVPGETLFSSIRHELAFAADGSRVCGDPGDPVTASGNWAVGPFAAGTYQIRGFYDKYGDFDPAFSISNLPTKGDVAGGAIENAAEALAGAPVKYQEIPVGVPDASGKLVIPDEGVHVSGIAVSLGLSLPLERPIFHVADVLDESPVGNKDAKKITMPADFQLNQFSAGNPPATEKSLIRVVLGAGLADTKLKAYGKTEAQLSSDSPFNLPNKDLFLLYARQDVNNDGKITSADHVPDSNLIPSLLPVAVFTKLPENSRLGSQVGPTIVLQGLTIYKDLFTTATAPANLNVPSDKVTVALRPAVACIDTTDPSKPGVLLLTHDKDTKDNPIIADEESVKAGLSAQFKRPFSIKYGCLPQGAYAMNLLYSTGQAWTVPNEAGVCAATEEQTNGGETCGTRPRFASQDVVITIGAPTDAAYCAKNATPPECLPAQVAGN
ncbi:MAG: hypothetical protein U0441_14020 [Polyangiaceae bacterium]